METNKLLNEIVTHKTFGTGVIRSIDDKYVTVEFKEINKISKFGYPAGFDGFLRLNDKEKQEEIEKELEVWREESGVLQKKELRMQYEKTLQAIEARRLAAEEKKLKAAQRFSEHRPQNNTQQGNKFRKFNRGCYQCAWRYQSKWWCHDVWKNVPDLGSSIIRVLSCIYT